MSGANTMAVEAEASAVSSPALVALIGAPNCGKTTVFNALTGLHYKTVNYPGATVEYAVGEAQLDRTVARIMDVPGIASLTAHSEDEAVALKALSGQSPHGVPRVFVAVVDATQMERHLYAVQQLLELNCTVIVAVTMVDILEKRKKMAFDCPALAESLGCPVLRIDGRTGLGIPALRKKIEKALADARPQRLELQHPPTVKEIAERYGAIKKLVPQVISVLGSPSPRDSQMAMSLPDSLTARLDHFLLHPVYGIVIFTLLMSLVFTSIFWLAAPLMDWVDGGFVFLAERAASALPAAWYTQLLTEGVIKGLGAVGVFVPQIMILFLALGALEDSGYLSRGAMIVDRPLAAVGLSGRSFVPILSAFACTVPAMLATRTIPSQRQRFLTMLILPMMLCSARLPVYGLLLSFLTSNPLHAGLALTGLYLFSVASGLVAAALLGRIVKAKQRIDTALLLELPAIRRPKLRVVVSSTYFRTKAYIQKAGGIILIASIVLWAMTNLPWEPGQSETERFTGSIAASAGRWMDPVMRPMGLDGRAGVALLSAFAAREVFVSSLALVLAASSEGIAPGEETLLLSMRQATLSDGTPMFTFASTVGLVVFFVFALQCMSTVVVCRKETGGWRIPGFQVVIFTGFAYLAAVAAVQGLRLMGLP